MSFSFSKHIKGECGAKEFERRMREEAVQQEVDRRLREREQEEKRREEQRKTEIERKEREERVRELDRRIEAARNFHHNNNVVGGFNSNMSNSGMRGNTAPNYSTWNM